MSTRDKLLELLISSCGEFVSGTEVAARLGVSGTAVWKAARKLQKEGYNIDAVTRKGYRLSADTDLLTRNGILQDLQSDIRLEVYDSVDSTNAICLTAGSQGEPEVFAAVAGRQTRGRGRRGRSFYSPADTGIYMSLLLRPPCKDPAQALRLTTIAAVAVCEAIEAVSGQIARIKWVNDVYISGRKVCGILTEASISLEGGTLDYAVVGIGINAYEPEGGFPADIADRAGAAFSHRVSNGRSRLTAKVLDRFMHYYGLFLKDLETESAGGHGENAYAEEYRKRCFVIGKNIDVITPASRREAVATGLTDDCRLIVKYEDGSVEELESGEISIRTRDQ